jgi:type IV pilus assembly protein PilY1
LGKGGKGYFCLLLKERKRTVPGDEWAAYETLFDVDDLQESATEQDVGRMVMWEYPVCPDGANDPDMGFSVGQGYVVNAHAPHGKHRPVAIFGNGYGSDSGRAVLYIVDALSGELLRKIDTGAGDGNGLSTPALVDANLDRRVDYVYAGDLKGNLWKFDLTAHEPHRWGVAYGEDVNRNGVIDARQGDRPQPVFRAGKKQPITGRPDVMSMAAACAPGAPGYLVVFGTGAFIDRSDMDDIHQQGVYAIWDFGEAFDQYPGHFVARSSGLLSSGLRLERRTIGDQYARDGITYRQLNDSTCEYEMLTDVKGIHRPAQCAGWFFDFPIPPEPYALAGERVTGKVSIRNGQVVVVSFAPNQAPCDSGGDSWVYVLDACGKDEQYHRMNDSAPARRYPGRIGEPFAIMKNTHYPTKDLLIGSDVYSGNRYMQEIDGEKWGKVFWQHNLHD